MEQLNTPVSSTTSYQTLLPPPEIMTAKDAFTAIKNATTTLDDVLDKMIDYNYHVGILGSKTELSKDIEAITNDISDQDKKRQQDLLEIKLILDDFLDNQIINTLKAQVEEDVNKEIDRLVEIHVKEHLEQYHTPEAVKAKVQESKCDLERERRRLHNSESKRANSLLRQRDGNLLLNTIYADDGEGEVSKDYPRTLKDLFDLDATMCKSLATEYKLPGVSDSREKNLNLLLRFFGIAYQMVR
ncbi:uncharacterized protein BT62DRAFT_963124 [Guyanagaster necrorhizus]|uniref:Uncharacterized protein n=1 Tax=Guyanagaster necrorhizus TaxID=856835 RepID=A0A9P8AVM7_9AGAR|nr:uncharacterized protein BT62DRAFT_963124 [Guyanagaster necrorhizus MCA 3950]KAG7449703.1 hypothetical protein BT62DRAFT_963124 [Guyanagaster necrorhizus MCA 3950]